MRKFEFKEHCGNANVQDSGDKCPAVPLLAGGIENALSNINPFVFFDYRREINGVSFAYSHDQ